MVGFIEDSDELAFGFLDPSLVIRGCHLIPRFASGRTNALMSYQGPTVARAPGCTEDWTNFYVNMHVPLIFRGFFELMESLVLLTETCSCVTMAAELVMETL